MIAQCKHPHAYLLDAYQYIQELDPAKTRNRCSSSTLTWTQVICPDCGFHEVYYPRNMPLWVTQHRLNLLVRTPDVDA